MSYRAPRFAFGAFRPCLALSVFLLLYAGLVLPSTAAAQAVSNAKMHGVITDATGAVVPGAVVVATQVESGQTATAIASGDGSFILPVLPVGAYTVKVTAPGFQTYNRTGILLQVSNDLEVNAPLLIGSADTVVNVESSGTQVQTEDNSITTIVDQARAVELPLNGRNAATLVLLSGGSAQTPANGDIISNKTYGATGVNAIGGSVAISVSGGQPNQINFLLDGGDNNDPAYNTNLPFPFPDALQEFSVQTTGLAAQYGVHPSGTVNIVTKSGTNEFHGGVFEFLRNNYANAANRISGKVSNLKRNQFGGYVGGPILTQKLFFFGGYQGTIQRVTPATLTAAIPTAETLAGNWTPYFQALKAASSTNTCPFTSTTKLTAAGFVANAATCTATISPSLYSPTALNFNKLLPTGTTQDALGDVQYAVPQPQTENQEIGRLDYTISPRQNVFARYFMANYNSKSEYGGNLLNTVYAQLIERSKNLTLGHNFTITQNLINSIRLDANRLAINRNAPPDLPNLASLGSAIYNPEPNYFNLTVSGAIKLACTSICAPLVLDANQIQIADDVSFSHGKHFLQFGFDGIYEPFNGKGFNNENGLFAINGSYSGFALADFLLGAVSSFNQSNAAAAIQHYEQKYIALYAQDTYHPLRSLVVNVGLRWEPYLPAKNRDGVYASFSQANFNSGIVSSVFVNAPAGLIYNGDPGVVPGFVTAKYLDFSPRFGVAFDPTGSGKQSIRASYDLVFDTPTNFGADQFWAQDAPYGNTTSYTPNNTLYKHTLDNPFQGVVGGNPFPAPFPPTANVAFPAAGITVADALGPNFHKPYMSQWNLSYQAQVSAKWLLSASYLGTRTVHLNGLFAVNYDNYYPGVSTGVVGSCGSLTPVPAAGTACSTTGNTTQRYKLYQQTGGTGAGTRYGGFAQEDDHVLANYNGLILTANHQLAKNFTALANYTYSKCLSNANYGGDQTVGPQNPADLASEYGPCNFDITHNFTVSGVLTTPNLGNHLLNSIVGGFQVSPLFSYHTGFPFTITSGTDASLTGVNQDRPNVVVGVQRYNKNLYPVKPSIYPQWFNTASFANPAPGTYGNERPYSLRAPGFANLDVAIAKFIPIHESVRLELRGEAFNALNHPNYGIPDSLISDANEGLILATANDARVLQIAAKIVF